MEEADKHGRTIARLYVPHDAPASPALERNIDGRNRMRAGPDDLEVSGPVAFKAGLHGCRSTSADRYLWAALLRRAPKIAQKCRSPDYSFQLPFIALSRNILDDEGV
jgi:hypothetical protein